MIVEFILNAFYGFVTFIIGIFPSLPPMPIQIQQGTQVIIDLIGNTIGVISYIYTPFIFTTAFVLLLAILNFDVIYKLVLWVYHKVRG